MIILLFSKQQICINHGEPSKINALFGYWRWLMPNSCELAVLMAVLYSPAPVQFPLVFDDGDDDGDDNVEISNASCKILQMLHQPVRGSNAQLISLRWKWK